MNVDWQVTDYFAGDLIHFLWCIGDGRDANRNYPQIKKHWRERIGQQVVNNLDYLMDWQTASVSASMLGTLFRYLPLESVHDMITLVDEPATMRCCIEQTEPKVRSSVSGYVHYVQKNQKRLLSVLSALDECGYDTYWHAEILPMVRKRCDETREALSAYSPELMRKAVGDLLGQASGLQAEIKPIYLTYFGYSLAYHLPDDSCVASFATEKPLSINGFVSTWLHELLHNFRVGEKVRQYCEKLSENRAFAKTRAIIRRWGQGDTEDLIVAAEKYLAVQLGVVTSEEAFTHIAGNYDGAQMLAGVLYDVMAREGVPGTYGEYLLELFRKGYIRPETIDEQYRCVLSQRLGSNRAEEIFACIDRAYQALPSC